MQYLIFYFQLCLFELYFMSGNLALCTGFDSSGKVCRARREPASLSVHPHSLTLLLMSTEDSLMFGCGDMQYKLFSVS